MNVIHMGNSVTCRGKEDRRLLKMANRGGGILLTEHRS